MAGGFIAFRCSNYENTAEREQFRLLCTQLREAYKDSDTFCLFIANYNIYDCEFDGILIKNDAIIAVEFKNYGGDIIALENGEWTSNNNIIKGGSRKTVYQQARINHVALRNGLRELGLNPEWIKDIPLLVVFNQDIQLVNQLSPKVRSWLHITDNQHFMEKIEDITCKSADLSNSEIIDVAIKMNLSNFIDKSLSLYSDDSSNKDKSAEKCMDMEKILLSYNRKTPNHVFNLRPNQVFVFGTDTRGSQRYGAAGIAAKRFGAQIGVMDGPTGNCYALPTKGYLIEDLRKAVTRFIQYVDNNKNLTFLVTPVGCGHAGFDVSEVANLFKGLLTYENVMLPDLFIQEYESSLTEKAEQSISLYDKAVDSKEAHNQSEIETIAEFYCKQHDTNNVIRNFALTDENGCIIAQAELVIEDEKIAFLPFNSQSVAAFKNHGYKIGDSAEFLRTHKF